MAGQNFLVVISFLGCLAGCWSPSDDRTDKNSRANVKLRAKEDSITKSDSLQIDQLITDYGLDRIDTFAVGDVDGDGKRDKAIIHPLTFFYRNGKMDSQYVHITFTCDIPKIKHYNGFSGSVTNVGDLDGNGTQEILYYPYWYQSNSAGIFIYGYRKHAWTLFARGSVRRDIISEAEDEITYLRTMVKKIDNTSFKLTEHLWNDEADLVDSISTIQIE